MNNDEKDYNQYNRLRFTQASSNLDLSNNNVKKLLVSEAVNIFIEANNKNDSDKPSDSISKSSTFQKQFDNPLNPRDNYLRNKAKFEEKHYNNESYNNGKTTISTNEDSRFKNIESSRDQGKCNLNHDNSEYKNNCHNNISAVDSYVESNNSSNNSSQMKKLNERLNSFMNNNYNYTYSNNNQISNPSPSNSNNSNEQDVDMDFLMNILNQCNNGDVDSNENYDRNENDDMFLLKENLNREKKFKSDAKKERDLKNNLTNNKKDEKLIQKLIINVLNKNKQNKEKSPISIINAFINNKLSNFLTNSNLTEKLLLYNLITNNNKNNSSVLNNVNNNEVNFYDNFNNNYDIINSFSKIFDHDTIEKFFQKEVIRFTIENFCKFLKDNGYTIIKNDNNNIKIDDEDDKNSRKNKEMICPHTDKKHYAKNMCNTCYHRQGRVKKAWLCPHSNRVHYARGKCRNCYLNFYHKKDQNKKKNDYADNINQIEDDSDNDKPVKKQKIN